MAKGFVNAYKPLRRARRFSTPFQHDLSCPQQESGLVSYNALASYYSTESEPPDIEKALKDGTNAVQLDPTYGNRFSLAAILLQREDCDKAVELF